MTRIGILGGTFNPPHFGHIACARAAADQLELDQVWLMPVAEPPHKRVEQDPGAEHRLALCRLAADEDERLSASALEVERGGPSYTVDTLAALRADRPHDELVFVAGGDMAMSLPAWREPSRVLELATFAVAEREDARREQIADRLSALTGTDRIAFFDMPRVDISSSLVRERVAAGEPVEDLLPAGVARYIDQRGLYRRAAVAAP
ncbi:MAG: nicotinate-nucleotide adenylyltransferase [Solirubrobacteraceae bacterium]|nr:nicotinate-nucleotide adenylyltransferase [Solirubrobacteraceae bacterium]